MRGPRSAGSLVSSGLLSVCTLCIQRVVVSRPIAKSELFGSGMRCVVSCIVTAPAPSSLPCSPVVVMAVASFFVLNVIVRREKRERFTMRESRTTSIVLSKCSEM